jgi:hypothetical protein
MQSYSCPQQPPQHHVGQDDPVPGQGTTPAMPLLNARSRAQTKRKKAAQLLDWVAP